MNNNYPESIDVFRKPCFPYLRPCPVPTVPRLSSLRAERLIYHSKNLKWDSPNVEHLKSHLRSAVNKISSDNDFPKSSSSEQLSRFLQDSSRTELRLTVTRPADRSKVVQGWNISSEWNIES